MEKSMIEWNKIMNMYQKSVEFSKTEITRQRQLEIEDFDNEMRPKYNQKYIKSLEDNFQKWLDDDIEREKYYIIKQ